jgi:putative N6-adenine-specific DNA methylase
MPTVPGSLYRRFGAGILRGVNTPLRGLALCAIGLEKICAHELDRLDLPCVERGAGRLTFTAGSGAVPVAAALQRANLRLRTAERILLELGKFPAGDFDELFEGVRALPWELCMTGEDRIVIERVRSRDSRLTAQTALQSVAHKAAYERMMRLGRLKRMPETGEAIGVRLYLEDDVCTVGVDCSGEALHKRGYRKQAGLAPLKETVAAGLLFLSGWTRRQALVDPFCGSGSIAIEAALYAVDRAPGLGRNFSLSAMPFADPAYLKREREDVQVRIRASDADPSAIAIARANAARAGVADIIEFTQAKAEDILPTAEPGQLLANPPYGERLGTPEEARALYGRLSGMRDRFIGAGWTMGFITNSPDFGLHFGLKPANSRHIVNGAEEQWFHHYPAPARPRSP